MNKNLEQDIEFLRQRIYLDEEDISELSVPGDELTDAIDDLRSQNTIRRAQRSAI
ncbi:MAG: hypothetical protein ACP5OC_05885 [Thermoplasmata archaeon]